jgi:hypothetical protein
MPNRILKDSICQSEKIDTISDAAECLYYRLMVQCDDYGTYKADARIIRSVCYPLKESMTFAKTGKLLTELIDAGLLMPYECDGKRYIYFLNWAKHQQIKNKRSKYPMPSNEEIEQYHSQLERYRSEKVRLSSLNPIQSNPIQSESNPNTNSVPVHMHGSEKNVKLTEEEYNRLKSEFPETDEAIEFLSLWLKDKGDKSKAPTHNATIRRWVIDAVRERRSKKGKPSKQLPTEYGRPEDFFNDGNV